MAQGGGARGKPTRGTEPEPLDSAGADLEGIPASHPRRRSLEMRQKLAAAVEAGLAHPSGLTAHGRGEAFDYLLGERTQPEAEAAERAAVEVLIAAERPVVSVNGNVAALAAHELAELTEAVNARRPGRRPLALEANVFHAGEPRVRKIVEYLEAAGAGEVLGRVRDARIPGLESHRALCAKDGIFAADAVLVPLEDGDRAQALKAMGKVVIALDLNPLSRTSLSADITIVDHLVRALPRMADVARRMDRAPHKGVRALAKSFDNKANLSAVRRRLAQALAEREG